MDIPPPSPDETRLREQIGKATTASGDRLESRLAFLGLNYEDAERLRNLAPLFQQYADQFVERFYEHLFAFPESANFLQDPQRVERLKQWQRAHFETLLDAFWNEEYVERRIRVGFTHAEVGVQPQYFLGAYNQYLQCCVPQFAAMLKTNDPGSLDWILSLFKVVLLDIGLTLDAYFAQSTHNLRDALDMFWQANTELRRFAQLTSHDLKTPLATVANLCDEALDEFGKQMPPEARDLIQQAKDGTFRMSRLIDELLSSAVDSSASDWNMEVDTTTVLDEAIQRVQPTLAKKQIDLQRPKKLPQVWGNKVRLREAFYNVLSNAAKFIDKSPGRITIEVQSDERDATISIRDNGPGIPLQELERIFVPFRRLADHRDVPGSGLGLYFTKSLIEAEGGRVWVESAMGEGSCFHLRIRRRPLGESTGN